MPLRGKLKSHILNHKSLYKILLPYKQQIEKLEKEISHMESRKLEVEATMANPDFYKNSDQAKKVNHEYKELQSKLESVYTSWSEVTEKISGIEQKEK
jgi:predicted  nucleic acid-binding Zn-ribbon protein